MPNTWGFRIGIYDDCGDEFDPELDELDDDLVGDEFVL
jgi:hypothetical protein